MRKLLGRVVLLLGVAGLTVSGLAQTPPLKVFISVDMEGIGGIGTSEMTNFSGKDYELGRRLMTDEVNTVVAAILDRGPAEILVNDSHGDMRNLLHLELDPRVHYIQGSVKPFGMVQGLDETFDAAIFLGYHARAGTEDAFLAHTGSGAVKGLWLNGREAGEGDLNAAYAGAIGVPVILAAGDATFVEQFLQTVSANGVKTKRAIGYNTCELRHPAEVKEELRQKTIDALDRLSEFRPWKIQEPVEIRMRFEEAIRTEVLESIPGVERTDGFTVRYRAQDLRQAYRLIRFMYKHVQF